MAHGAAADRDVFDYVVVGGGAAGCVLANRLSSDPSRSVCVLEAGGSDRKPMIYLPAGFVKNLFNPRLTWGFRTEPGDHIAGRRIDAIQARVLGGGSSINGMVYNRGQAGDFDRWAELGNPGWGSADLLPYFRRSERRVGATPDQFRGAHGTLPVSSNVWTNELCEAFIAGAAEQGIPLNPDYNGASQEGVGYYQRTIESGLRVNAARAFLRPAMARRNLEVRTSSTVLRVKFEGTRACAVEYVRNDDRGVVRSLRARREIILASGAINTAKTLMLSGIGPASTLADLGIAPVVDLPGVGRNLQDHFAVRTVARVRKGSTLNELSRGPRLAYQALLWALGKPSILALSGAVVHVFWKSDPRLAQPDLQGSFAPGSFADGFNGDLDKNPGVTMGVFPQRPASRGYVALASPDPFAAPVVQPNYLAEAEDQALTVAGLKMVQGFLATPKMRPYLVPEAMPGVRSDAELLQTARQQGTTCYHFAGTARMGPQNEATAVVGSRLHVHGTQGLRVVDASVMPCLPSANTYAATLTIAEKASDMLLEQTGGHADPAQRPGSSAG